MTRLLLHQVPAGLTFAFGCGCQYYRKPKRARTGSSIERVRVRQRCASHRGRGFSRRLVTALSDSTVWVDPLAIELEGRFAS